MRVNGEKMKPPCIQSIRSYVQFGFMWLLLFACLFNGTGCSISSTVDKTTESIANTTRKITTGFTGSDSGLKRTVGIIDFKNKSLRVSRDFEDIFHKGLPEYLGNECKGILVATSDNSGPSSQLRELPRLPSGEIDNFALAILGRQLGLNAVVAGSLEDIRVINELKGILWTKDAHYEVQVYIRVEVYDSQTGTKIVDDTLARDIEIDELEYQLIRKNETIRMPELNETLNKLVGDVGDSICEAVKAQRWNGFITKVDGDKIVISSGSRIGLQPGDILEVYDSSRIIEGAGGQRFYVPGLKSAEIEISALTENEAEAMLVSGDSIQPGSTVQRK
jgi:hypothetical protein